MKCVRTSCKSLNQLCPKLSGPATSSYLQPNKGRITSKTSRKIPHRLGCSIPISGLLQAHQRQKCREGYSRCGARVVLNSYPIHHCVCTGSRTAPLHFWAYKPGMSDAGRRLRTRVDACSLNRSLAVERKDAANMRGRLSHLDPSTFCSIGLVLSQHANAISVYAIYRSILHDLLSARPDGNWRSRGGS
jgi:hypothetical protein